MLQVALKVTPETPPRSRTSRSLRAMSATASLFPSTWCSRGCSPAPRWRPPTSKSVSCYWIFFYKCRRLYVYFSCDPAVLLSWWWCLSPFRIWSQHRHCSSWWSSDHRELPSEAVQSLNLSLVRSPAGSDRCDWTDELKWRKIGLETDQILLENFCKCAFFVSSVNLYVILLQLTPLPSSPDSQCQNAEKTTTKHFR